MTLHELRARKAQTQAKFDELKAGLPALLAEFETADAALTDALGRQQLGEATAEDVDRARQEATRALEQVKGFKSAETVLKDRLRETETALIKAEREQLNAMSQLAGPLLTQAVERVQKLASELGEAILLATQLDCAARRDTGMRSGPALNQAVGDPLGVMASKGVLVAAFRLPVEPRALTVEVLRELSS